ncbi:hypothetical protein [Aquamicrobium zhengzhouense]|uniref:H-NS histone family protein n=1 Tax=Aquamicrobium zhengzhouense TaxID=2781738 RepID=A0ABS0S9T6_9HYPH|nr:hypothetical protein [Aquamicrobium zhengzhouense]MBI1620054.1 hypothetical protein [Aquamicrobium zhengzhouense]
MHNIKELERQLEQAKSRHTAAERDLREAKDRVIAAKGELLMRTFADMGGVVGVTRVRIAHARLAFNTSGPYFVMGWEKPHYGTDPKYHLAKIKKDGTPSNAPSGASTDKVLIRPEDQV